MITTSRKITNFSSRLSMVFDAPFDNIYNPDIPHYCECKKKCGKVTRFFNGKWKRFMHGHGRVIYIVAGNTKKKLSEAIIKYYITHPEARIRSKETFIKYRDCPEKVALANVKNIEYWSNPENRKNQSIKRKEYFKNHPEAGEDIGKRNKKYYSVQENKEAYSKKMSQFWSKSENREINSIRMKKWWKDHPEARLNLRINKINRMKKDKDIYFARGTYEKEILDQYEEEHEIILDRKFSHLGYFPDGYDHKNNRIIEVYEPYHKDSRKMEYDKHREKLLKESLKCEFIIIWEEEWLRSKELSNYDRLKNSD